jgi:cell division protein FtsW (lipid II flippase)
MRNKKTWLIIKGALILLFTFIIFAMPVQDGFRKWLRFGMLTLFVSSFIIDLNKLNKNKK